MAANCGRRQLVAVTKRTERLSLKLGNGRNELRGSVEWSGIRANKRTPSAAWRLDGATEAPVIGVERVAPIGGIGSSPRRDGTMRTGKTKPRLCGKKGVCRFGKFCRLLEATSESPEPRDPRSIQPAGSGHPSPVSLPHRMAPVEEGTRRRGRRRQAWSGGTRDVSPGLAVTAVWGAPAQEPPFDPTLITD
jgi:hypothetical protein